MKKTILRPKKEPQRKIINITTNIKAGQKKQIVKEYLDSDLEDQDNKKWHI